VSNIDNLKRSIILEVAIIEEFSSLGVSMAAAEEWTGVSRVIETIRGHTAKLATLAKDLNGEAPTPTESKPKNGKA
jgi:hypothetical protein